MIVMGGKFLRFENDDGCQLAVHETNRGEPFRKGIEISIEERGEALAAFIEDSEAIALRDLLNKLYPVFF